MPGTVYGKQLKYSKQLERGGDKVMRRSMCCIFSTVGSP